MTSKCHLLDLPYELRLQIYSHLLRTEAPISITDNTSRLSEIQHIHLYPQLLQTCRQINSEGSAVLYGDNIFETLGHTNGYFGRSLAHWLSRIGRENIARLRRLKVAMLYPPIPRGGLCCVETVISLRLPRRSQSVLKCWRPEVGTRPGMFEMEPWTGRLDPDTEVEVRLEFLARQNAEIGEGWHALDIMSLYNAASQIQPILSDAKDMDEIPPEVAGFINKSRKPRTECAIRRARNRT